MLAWLRSWKGGFAVAASCLVIGLARVLDGRSDWLTWASFPLAVGYALAAVVERRARNARRAVTRPDGVDPTPWTTQPSRLAAWFASERGRADHPGQGSAERDPLLTKDRIGAVLALTAAVVGLVLVYGS